MGIVRFGAPEREITYLRDQMNLSVFFEGGTYKGQTALVASKIFGMVFTVEKSEAMFDLAKANINGAENIKLLGGDTRDHLKSVLAENNNILFWLDAHWSGSETYGEDDECPLLDELRIIFSADKNYAVLIDDAQLFLAPPPRPHDAEKWPTISDIVKIVPDGYGLFVFEDVIYLLPREAKRGFRDFLQYNITEEWNKQREKGSLIARTLRRIGIYPC